VTVGPANRLSPEDAAWDRLYAEAYERLDRRLVEHNVILPEAFPSQDIVIVARFEYDYARATGSKLHLPQTAMSPESPYSVGLLIFAGMEASDVLESHGTFVGDYVTFARFAGEEYVVERIQEAIATTKKVGRLAATGEARAIRDEAMSKQKLLKLKAPELHESVDLLERLCGATPTMRHVRTVTAAGDPLHVIKPIL